MSRHTFDMVNSKGLNTDIIQTSLPFDYWSKLDNVVCVAGTIRSTYGELKKIDFQIEPIYHATFRDKDGGWFIIISDGINVRMINAFTGADNSISPTSKPSTAGFVSITVLNSVLIVNYDNAGPFYYSTTDAKLMPLKGWDNDWRCKYMIAYRYYLVALNMTESAVNYPYKIRWSNSAQEGDVPLLWVPAVDNDAGDDILGETLGHIVGAVLVREYLYIVKEDSIYAMSYIGGQFIMRTDRLHGSAGTVFRRGFTEYGGNIAICDGDDIRYFDGQTTVSIVHNRVSKALNNILKDDYNAYSILFRHVNAGLLILAAPTGSTEYRLQNALIYDFLNDTWYEKSLNYCFGFDWLRLTDTLSAISEILVYESNSANTQWWASSLGASVTNSDETNKTCWAVKSGIRFEGSDGMAMINEAWLDIITDIPVEIAFGAQETPTGTITWGDTEVWQPDVTKHLTPRITGRYFAVSIKSTSGGTWKIGSITINWQRAGER